MPEKGSKHEVDNILTFLLTEDQDAVGWSLVLMLGEDVFQHFYSNIDLTLSLDHGVKDEVHDG